jgi:hypothetical protein
VNRVCDASKCPRSNAVVCQLNCTAGTHCLVHVGSRAINRMQDRLPWLAMSSATPATFVDLASSVLGSALYCLHMNCCVLNSLV